MSKCNRQAGAFELPNLFLATTYALNKSDSKRICIGLEHSNGYFRETIKLLTGTDRSKTVTLDRHGWECFKDQFASIESYFTNSYSFYHDHGRPNKAYLPRHDLFFSTSYGVKSILLDEAPQRDELVNFNPSNHSTQNGEPDGKRRKVAAPPGIVMQQPTFDGLYKQSLLVDLTLDSLREKADRVNRTFNLVREYVQDKIAKKEDEEVTKTLLTDLKAFESFYNNFKDDIEVFISDKLGEDYSAFINGYLKLVLAEFASFGLPILMQILYLTLLATE